MAVRFKDVQKASGDSEGRSWASSPAIRRSMQANRPWDTGPERALRSALFRKGLRFRKHYKPLAQAKITVDVAFPRERIAVFMDGCFWHGCPEHGSQPATHREFWESKIRRNRERDRIVDQMLSDAGWAVVRVWEHEDLTAAVERITEIVKARSVLTVARNLNK